MWNKIKYCYIRSLYTVVFCKKISNCGYIITLVTFAVPRPCERSCTDLVMTPRSRALLDFLLQLFIFVDVSLVCIQWRNEIVSIYEMVWKVGTETLVKSKKDENIINFRLPAVKQVQTIWIGNKTLTAI